MTVWFTSDTHFGHARIIELANRPFESVEHMDKEMIRLWNEVVQPNDIVYHLGDFAFADHTPYLEQLNGTKYLLKGNHDSHKRLSGAKGWAAIYPSLWEIKGHPHLILCHYALRVWNKSGHGSIHLYGHSHNNLEGDAQSCDVGVDAWSFRPISLEMIQKKLDTYPKRVEPDHHAPKVESVITA